MATVIRKADGTVNVFLPHMSEDQDGEYQDGTDHYIMVNGYAYTPRMGRWTLVTHWHTLNQIAAALAQ